MINLSDERIKEQIKIKRIFYNKDNFYIFQSEPILTTDNNTDKEVYLEHTFKGECPTLELTSSYMVKAKRVKDEKFGLQYQIEQIYIPFEFKKDDKEGKRTFLEHIFTPGQVESLYETLEEPFDTLQSEDYVALCSVKGVGMKTAINFVDKFKKHLGKAKIYVELADYDLTENMVEKLLDVYGGNPDLLIEKVSKNPYSLIRDVPGIGFAKADEIAQKGGMTPDCPERIAAFIQVYLYNEALNGYSWMTTDQLLGAILDKLGEEIPDEKITEALGSIKDLLWVSEDQLNIGLKRFYTIELNIATELIRLRDAETDIIADNWTDAIKRLEGLNGWEFTEEQKQAVQMGVDNNVLILTGYGGTGKSSAVSAILKALGSYPFYQTALSGRAASRLFEVTGYEGQTIHRLLGYPLGEPRYGGFKYNQDNQLSKGIYIVDETSMIGGDLFHSLIRAIPSGSKLILLGDYGQLESIGMGNILYDAIHSGEIPAINLTKIHRQAAKSAIITESLKVRQGKQIVPKDWAGKETRGELQDLHLNCFSDASNTVYEAIKTFTAEMSKPDFDIMKVQMIAPVKTRGDACVRKLNELLQDMYNPLTDEEKSESGIHEIKVFQKNYVTFLRVGDKVINKKNNYRMKDVYGNDTAIFNGSIGIVKEIRSYTSIVIDFAYIGEVVVNKDALPGIELGYCITCHSSQGSEFDTVIFCLDVASYSLLTRELVYTSITRAKKQCHLIAQTSALRMAVGREGVSVKQTHLQNLLYEVAHPKLDF